MILNVFQIFSRFKQLWSFVCINYPAKEKFGKDCYLEYPIFAQTPSSVFFQEHSKIRRGCTIINSPSEKIVIKKFTVISVNTTIVSQNHVSTVGIPQFLLGPSHINDKRADLIIEEDVWCGANVNNRNTPWPRLHCCSRSIGKQEGTTICCSCWNSC